jgi:hypothetical protein
MPDDRCAKAQRNIEKFRLAHNNFVPRFCPFSAIDRYIDVPALSISARSASCNCRITGSISPLTTSCKA